MPDVVPGAGGGRGLRVLGHPLHAALSAFPLAAFSVSVLVDVVAWLGASGFWWRVSFWVVAAGLVSAVPTAIAGLVDYTTIVEGEGATKAGTTHMLVMFSVVACFGIDLVLRGGAETPRGLALISTLALDAVGATLVMVGGWYGGELVFGHGVGQGRL